MTGIMLKNIVFLTINVVILPDTMLSQCCLRLFKSSDVLRR